MTTFLLDERFLDDFTRSGLSFLCYRVLAYGADHPGRLFYLNAADIARRLGCHRSTVGRAIEDLTQGGWLVPDGEGFRAPIVASPQQIDARPQQSASPTQQSAHPGLSQATEGPSDHPGRAPIVASPQQSGTRSQQSDAPPQQSAHAATVAPTATLPIVASLRQSDAPPQQSDTRPQQSAHSRTRPKNPVVPPPLHSPPVLEKSVSGDYPHTPPPDPQDECVCDSRGEPIVLTRTEDPDPEELTRIEELAESCFPTRFFGPKVTTFSAKYPLAWIEKALLEASCWSQPPQTWKPIWNLLQRWAKAGGPPAAPEPAPASAARNYDPRSPHGARQAQWDRDLEIMKQRIARSAAHASA